MVVRSLSSLLVVLATAAGLDAGDPTPSVNVHVITPVRDAVSVTRPAAGPTRDVFVCIGPGDVSALVFDVDSTGMTYQCQSFGIGTGSGFPAMAEFTSPDHAQFLFTVPLIAIVVVDVLPVLPPPPNQLPAYTVLVGYTPPPPPLRGRR